MKKILLILLICFPLMAETKFYKDSISGKEIQDDSGIKNIEQLKIDFNCPNLQDITIQRQSEILANQVIIQQLKLQLALYEAQKQQDINTNLPTWQQVSDAIDGATTLAQLKAIVKKMARVEYWIVKNKPD